MKVIQIGCVLLQQQQQQRLTSFPVRAKTNQFVQPELHNKLQPLNDKRLFCIQSPPLLQKLEGQNITNPLPNATKGRQIISTVTVSHFHS